METRRTADKTSGGSELEQQGRAAASGGPRGADGGCERGLPGPQSVAAVPPPPGPAGVSPPLPDGARTPAIPQLPTDLRTERPPHGAQRGGLCAELPPQPPPKLPPARGSGLGLRPPARPGPAGLTFSARWWTRPRPGSTSSCSSPSSGSNRRPAKSRGQQGPAGPRGRGAAMFVPASPAASAPSKHFRG